MSIYAGAADRFVHQNCREELRPTFLLQIGTHQINQDFGCSPRKNPPAESEEFPIKLFCRGQPANQRQIDTHLPRNLEDEHAWILQTPLNVGDYKAPFRFQVGAIDMQLHRKGEVMRSAVKTPLT